MPDKKNTLKKQFPCAKFNAFLMMRFAPNDINGRIRRTLIAEADRYSIDVHRADHRNSVRNKWENIKNYMNACDLGIAVFDQIQDKYPNSNVCLEIGYMLARDLQDKMLLLKEKKAEIPSDMDGLLYETFDANNLEASIRVKLLRWLVDIGVAKAPKEKLVVFVSAGGQDRCAMAKVIAEGLFEDRRGRNIRFESMAALEGRSGTASKWSRTAVNRCRPNQPGLLDTHRVMRLCDGIVEDADLILVMEKGFLGIEAFVNNRHKTFLITEFFGKSGDIKDPDPSRDINKYVKCFNQLEGLISRKQLLIGLDRVSSWPVCVSAFRSNGIRPPKTLNIADEVACPVCDVTYSLCIQESTARDLPDYERDLLREKASAKLVRWLRYSEKHQRSHPKTLSLPDDIID